jgi:hypothetical protein
MKRSKDDAWKRYLVATPRERFEWWLWPKVCRVVGHKPQGKFSCVICQRCMVVLSAEWEVVRGVQ